jgi:hypothetical protein
MSLPKSANATCDIYRAGNAPPAAPDVAAVPCSLEADYARGLERGEFRSEAVLNFTHIMLVDAAVDIRDNYSADLTTTLNSDAVYVSDQTGTRFIVTFVEIKGKGTPHEFKKVYLRRSTVTWPTQEL